MKHEDSYAWMCHIRKSYPTAIFYFSQSENDVIVIYYTDKAGQVQAVVANCVLNGVYPGTAVPADLFAKYLCLHRLDNGCYHLPGVLDDLQWTLGNRTLRHEDSMLIQVHGTVLDNKIHSVHLVSMHMKEKTLSSREVQCQGHLQECVPDLRSFYRLNGYANKLKTLLG
jgi:hypothetical protein